MKTSRIFFLVAALTTSACTPENSALSKPPGTYHSDVKSTDANGVTTEHSSTTDVGYNADGSKHAVVQAKTTKKPPGLINGWLHKRTTDQSTQVIDER